MAPFIVMVSLIESPIKQFINPSLDPSNLVTLGIGASTELLLILIIFCLWVMVPFCLFFFIDQSHYVSAYLNNFSFLVLQNLCEDEQVQYVPPKRVWIWPKEQKVHACSFVRPKQSCGKICRSKYLGMKTVGGLKWKFRTNFCYSIEAACKILLA